jgi:spermidine dehydrogenase
VRAAASSGPSPRTAGVGPTSVSRRRDISRRDFLGGVALGTAAGALAPAELLARTAAPAYPPALTGLRGSQPGAFDVAHALAWQGKTFPRPAAPDETPYDLVVVGGGISGLAAAFYWRQAKGPDARILILDNHDDFGGHARRNEFTVDGQRLVGYGGSQSIDTPGRYSPQAAQLLRDVGIVTDRFYEYFDQSFSERMGLDAGIWFSREAYGRDVTAPGLDLWRSPEKGLDRAQVDAYPIGDAARAALLELFASERNYLAHLPPGERVPWLRRTSYRDFLLGTVGVPEAVYLLFRDQMRGWWGVGWDAVSAAQAADLGMPGTRHLALPEPPSDAPERDEPYIFHFPDGNAGVARSLVRALIPDAVPGSTMEDLVLARADYGALDRARQPCRLRLSSTAVDVRHRPDESAVDVSYVHNGQVRQARGRHVVLACYNAMVPYLCPELPAAQREAIAYAEKVPLVYLSMAVRNWRPLAELGMRSISVPRPDLMHSFGLDFPVSMGGVEFARDPGRPTVLHGSYIPAAPDRGLSAVEQHRVGRRAIYELSLDDFERRITRQLDGALGRAGFDVERDLAGLTVNRWPHGYAYEYNELFDPPEYGRDQGPHRLGARQLGRISIANSDASAWAFVDGAIDAAWRATREQLG